MPNKSEREAAKARLVGVGNKPTERMLTALEKLLAAQGFSTRVQRNGYLSRMAGRDIRFIDDLTFDEASKIIGDRIANIPEKPQEVDPDEEDETKWSRHPKKLWNK
jgi:hypothetical protein